MRQKDIQTNGQTDKPHLNIPRYVQLNCIGAKGQ